MDYKSYDQEWDNTCNEMQFVTPKLGDKVLCAGLDVQAGEVVEIKHKFFVVRLEDGSVDEYLQEDVLVRSAA
jgi:hypothetical protein